MGEIQSQNLVEGAASKGHTVEGCACYAVSDDSRLLAVGDLAGIVRVFDAVTGRELVRISAHPVWVDAIAFDHAARRLVTSGGERSLRIWDVETGIEVLTLLEPGSHRIEELRFTADGTRLIGQSTAPEQAYLIWHASPPR